MTTKNINTIFVNNIIFLLKKQKIKQQVLCDETGISPPYMSLLLNHKANPSLKNMSKIADFFEIPLPVLLAPMQTGFAQYPNPLNPAQVYVVARTGLQDAFLLKKNAIKP